MKIRRAEWRVDCDFDPANPAFFIKDYSRRGRALNADYKIKRDKDGRPAETAIEYWSRIRKEIAES